MQQSLRDNAALTLRAFAGSLRSPTGEPMSTAATDRRLKQLDVRATSFDEEARLLSGGNQQRVIIARWLALDPRVLIFSEPTRGIDVAAKAAIYRIMRELADRGRAILMISSDLPEIVGVSDRIIVMREGAVAGELPGGASEEDVMAIAGRTRPRPARDAPVSDAGVSKSGPAGGRGVGAPALLLVGSVALYVGVALWTGQTKMLETDGVIGLLQRMVALGAVALGQTFTILAGSIDLSVANLISVAAVLASFIMQGRTEMMLPALAIVLVVSALVGVVNGALVSRLQVNPLIATLGVGLILQGMLSASFTDFAGSVPREFQAVAYGAFGVVPYSVAALFVLAAVASIVLRATRFGAHLYAVGGNAEGARLAGIRTDLVTIGAHVVQPFGRSDRPLSRQPPSVRRALDRTRRRL